MNNRGFTLIEVLIALVLITLVLGIAIKCFSSTTALDKEEAYKVMKSNIISASYDYISECDANVINCYGTDSFYASVLMEYGYFDSLNSPIDGRDVSHCLLIKTSRKNGIKNVYVEDFCY